MLTKKEHAVTTQTIIHFEDQGQDILKWILDKDGYVVESLPCQSCIFRRYHVQKSKIRLGHPLQVVSRSGDLILIKYKVIQVTTIQRLLENPN